MGKQRCRVMTDVVLDGMPVVLVVTDLSAIRTDRQYLLQGFYFRDRSLELAQQLLALFLGLLALRDITRDRVDDPLGGIRRRIPPKPRR